MIVKMAGYAGACHRAALCADSMGSNPPHALSPPRRDTAGKCPRLEMIIHADRDFVDGVLETGHAHDLVWLGQRKSLAAEVVIIILERR
jgi:hypothetical protein